MTIAETLAALADALGQKGLEDTIEVHLSDRLFVKLAADLGNVSLAGEGVSSMRTEVDSSGQPVLRIYGKTGVVAAYNRRYSQRFGPQRRTAIYDAIEAALAQDVAEHGGREYCSPYTRIVRLRQSTENAWLVFREDDESALSRYALLRVAAMAVAALEALERERREVENG